MKTKPEYKCIFCDHVLTETELEGPAFVGDDEEVGIYPAHTIQCSKCKRDQLWSKIQEKADKN